MLAKNYNKNGYSDLSCKYQNGYYEGTYGSIIQQWLDYFILGKLEINNNQNGLINLNFAEHNLVDVGFGASQVLPIIVQGCYMQKDQTLLLEQPEIHLHPNLQMKIADFFITLAQTDRNVIIETHSDHIINRITRRVLEDQTGKLRNLIKIYFVQGYNTKCPICKDITFSSTDGLINAPDDFFTQFGSELMYITKLGMKNEKEGTIW